MTKFHSEAEQIKKAALTYIKSGLSVLPTGKDKIPLLDSWKNRQYEIPSDESVKADFSKPGTCVALVTGKVSGNLEILDFDFNGGFFDPWQELVEKEHPGLIKRLVKQKTQHNGFHIAYRCPEIEIPGNTKLASECIEVSHQGEHEFKGKSIKAIKRNGKFYITPCFIETRSEGGYFLVYPSPGYKIEQNRFSQVPDISKEERKILIESAKALNKFIPEHTAPAKAAKNRSYNELTPGDDFDDRGNVESILQAHGWINTGRTATVNGDPGEHWKRPGKERGQSATLIKGKHLYVFSTNGVPFEADRIYSPFAIYTILEHGGDFSAAAKELSRQGYGSKAGVNEMMEERQSNVIPIQSGEEWGNPVDIFNESLIIIPAWEENYSPDVISKLGYDFAERMGIRPEQVIGPAIINAAGVIDDNFKLQPKENDHTWSESARINAAILGISGSKKSPAKQQVDKIVKSIQRKMIETHMEEMEYYESLDKKEQKKTPEPVLKRIICGDSTIEGLRGILKKDGGARKVNCSWDEMSGWLGSFDLYQKSGSISRDRAAFMELYEGGPKYFDRVNAGFIYVPNWSTCICGTITPSLMADFFGKLNTDGLLQRFLLYQAEQTGPGVDRKPDDFLIEKYETTIRNLTKLKPEGIETFKLDQDAQEVREEFEGLVKLAAHLPGATEAFKAHLNKYPGMLCRLTLTYHIADALSTGKDPAKRVTGKIAAMAAGALISYHMPLARNFYKTLGYEDKIENEAEDVCNFILARKYNEISSREIAQKVKSLKNKAPEIRNVMEVLEAYGWVKTSKSVGLKATWWKINPAIHKLFEEQAKTERKRRQEERAKILKAVETFKQNVDDVDCAREEKIK